MLRWATRLRLGTVMLSLLACAAAQATEWQPLAAEQAASKAMPDGLAQLPPGSVTQMQRVKGKQVGADRSTWVLPSGQQLQARMLPNTGPGEPGRSRTLLFESGWGLSTEGAEVSFATLRTAQGRFEFEARGDAGWLVALDHPQLQETLGTDDAIGPGRGAELRLPSAEAKAGETVIDVLFAYTQGFAARYPGSAAETRIQHLLAIANQGLSNSNAGLILRLVGSEPVAYNDANDNGDALNDMQRVMRGEAVTGLEGLRQLRTSRGADLVTLIRPHDIETRGSCGIAYLFADDAARGVNVLSDGASTWSLCATETYMHEVGHNLGAEHQPEASSNPAGSAHAFIRPGQFHTVMGSFGTGEADRGRRLLRFSNPAQRCGGHFCGVFTSSDNTRRVVLNKAQVAAYVAAVSTVAVSAPTPIDPDEDGDGVAESEDAFPHDARWQQDRDQDGVADPVDAFPDDPVAWADLDGDGVDDAVDPDRDGDGVPNSLDALPDDGQGSVDSDADRVADTVDAFPADPIESRDLDGDGVGDFADADADADGVDDLFATELGNAGFDLLVQNGGEDQLLRLDADGGFVQRELQGVFAPQALGSQARLFWDGRRKSLWATFEAGIHRFQRAPVMAGQAILARSNGDGGPALPGAFPSGLAIDEQDRLFVAELSSQSVSRFRAATREALPAGLFGLPFGLREVPRDLLLSQGRLWVLLRDGGLTEIDTESGAILRELLPAQLYPQASVDMAAFTAAADGSLWIADRAADAVWRFSPDAASAQRIVPPVAGGLQDPAGLDFAPDGSLVVSSRGNHRVLRFDPNSGAALGDLVALPGTVLREPGALLFVPKVQDRYPLDASRSDRLVLGGWFNPARSGHGLEIARVGDLLAVTWYTFDAAGEPTWYQGLGAQVGRHWQADLLRYRWQNGQAEAETVGRAQLQLSGERSLEFSWTLADSSGQESMQPIDVGYARETQAPTAAWYPPAESGWGLSLGRQGDTAYGLVFYYRLDGSPSWAFGGATYAEAGFELPLLQGYGPTRCPGCPGAAEPEYRAVGRLRFTPDTALQHAEVDIEASAAGLDWQRQGSAFQPLTDFPTDRAGLPLP